MKNTLKGYVIGVLSTVMLLGCVTYAAGNTKTIEALYNNIKIYVDGVKVDPKDANGNTVEPFIYNGTTYLPVRAVGEAIGKTVTWDGTTQSVYLGKVPGQSQSWMDVCKPYDYISAYEYLLSENKVFTMSGEKYSNGFTMEHAYNNSEVMFNLNGRFQSLTFKVGHVDERLQGNAILNIYLDNKLVKTEKLSSNTGIKSITVPLNGALHLRFELTEEGYQHAVFGFADGIFN